MRDLPAGTLTLLFTDIEGSTQLQYALGDAYPEVLAAHRDLVRTASAAHAGVEVDTQGDAFFYVFPRASQAVAAAVAAQQALAATKWPQDGAVRVRMGLHTGEPQRTAEGYAGLDVHRAARVAAAGHGGQVLLSEATAVQVRQRLPDEVHLRDLGAHRLKDLAQPEHLYQLDVGGLPSEFPPVRSLDTRPNNLPTPSTPLIGREHEVEQLVQLLRRDDVRLVTLTGPGGSGKTRLGLRAATELLHDFPDGVFIVELAPIADPALVMPTIAQALGVREAEGHPVAERLASYLRDQHLLLLLDNFEQVLPAGRGVAALLGACPGLKVLVTSRAPLHLSGERDYAVPPLPLPQPGSQEPTERVSQYAAVRLFIERAVAVRTDFQVTNENAPAVAEICARLDGLPLAIELAAARIRVLPPQALLARLGQRLRLLIGGAQDLPARQRTLRDTIAWSHDLLAPPDRTLLRRLAVFVGGCTLETAEAVCNADLSLDVLEGVAALIENNLLREAGGPDGEPRYTMLETIREYALERLAASGEEEAVRQAHARAYLALATQAERALWSPEQRALSRRLTADRDNVRAALRWCLERGEAEPAMHAVGALYWWFVRESVAEGVRWAEALLALPAPGSTGASPARSWQAARARALMVAGGLGGHVRDTPIRRGYRQEAVALSRELGDSFLLGFTLWDLATYEHDPRVVRATFEESAAVFRQVGERWLLVNVLAQLGMVTLNLGDEAAAEAALAESVAIGRAFGYPPLLAQPEQALGWLAWRRDDLVAARSHLDESVRLFRQDDMSLLLAEAVFDRGCLAYSTGDAAHATACFAECLALARRLGISSILGVAVEGLAGVAAVRGQGETAARLFGAADAVMRSSAWVPRSRWPHLRPYRQRLRELQDALAATPSGQAVWAAGRALALDDAIAEAVAVAAEASAEALREDGDTPALVPWAPMAAGGHTPLTAREAEVLRLLARGKSNPEIAADLVLSVKTVERHLANIYAKIDTHGRTQAVAYALRNGLG